MLNSLPEPMPCVVRIIVANKMRFNFIQTENLQNKYMISTSCSKSLAVASLEFFIRAVVSEWFGFVSFFNIFTISCSNMSIGFGYGMNVRWKLYGMSIHMTCPSNIERWGALYLNEEKKLMKSNWEKFSQNPHLHTLSKWNQIKRRRERKTHENPTKTKNASRVWERKRVYNHQ